MKKQIFILAIALLAAVTSFGQSVPGSAPRPITTCADGPLSPIAGRPYTYTANSIADGNWTFWATKDPTFIITDAAGVTTNNLATRLTTPTDLIETSANYGKADAANNVTITWSDDVLSKTTATSATFVAALKEGGTTCANNFNAWQLQPINAFTVDILNLDDATKAPGTGLYDYAESQCFDIVRGAKWNGTQMQYDFGKNILYFEVVAANFTNYWTPTFTLTGLNAVQAAVIEWTVEKPTAWSATTVWNNYTTTPTTKVTTTETNTKDGVSIYVRVTVSNNNFEGLAAADISLAVDGQNSIGLWDVINETCVATAAADFVDVAKQTLNPRPTVTADPSSTPFVPGNQL